MECEAYGIYDFESVITNTTISCGAIHEIGKSLEKSGEHTKLYKALKKIMPNFEVKAKNFGMLYSGHFNRGAKSRLHKVKSDKIKMAEFYKTLFPANKYEEKIKNNSNNKQMQANEELQKEYDCMKKKLEKCRNKNKNLARRFKRMKSKLESLSTKHSILKKELKKKDKELENKLNQPTNEIQTAKQGRFIPTFATFCTFLHVYANVALEKVPEVLELIERFYKVKHSKIPNSNTIKNFVFYLGGITKYAVGQCLVNATEGTVTLHSDGTTKKVQHFLATTISFIDKNSTIRKYIELGIQEVDKEDSKAVLDCVTSRIDDAVNFFAEVNGITNIEPYYKAAWKSIGICMTDSASVNMKFARELENTKKGYLTNMNINENITIEHTHCLFHFEVNLKSYADKGLSCYENDNVEKSKGCSTSSCILFSKLSAIAYALSGSDKYSLFKIWEHFSEKKHKMLRPLGNREYSYFDNCYSLYMAWKCGCLKKFLAGSKKQLGKNSNNKKVVDFILHILQNPRLLGALRSMAILHVYVLKPLRKERMEKNNFLSAAEKLQQMQANFDKWSKDINPLNEGKVDIEEKFISKEDKELLFKVFDKGEGEGKDKEEGEGKGKDKEAGEGKDKEEGEGKGKDKEEGEGKGKDKDNEEGEELLSHSKEALQLLIARISAFNLKYNKKYLSKEYIASKREILAHAPADNLSCERSFGSLDFIKKLKPNAGCKYINSYMLILRNRSLLEKELERENFDEHFKVIRKIIRKNNKNQETENKKEKKDKAEELDKFAKDNPVQLKRKEPDSVREAPFKEVKFRKKHLEISVNNLEKSGKEHRETPLAITNTAARPKRDISTTTPDYFIGKKIEMEFTNGVYFGIVNKILKYSENKYKIIYEVQFYHDDGTLNDKLHEFDLFNDYENYDLTVVNSFKFK